MLKQFSQNIVFEVEIERIVRSEETTRLEILNLEGQSRMNEVVIPFFAGKNSRANNNEASSSSSRQPIWANSATSTIYTVKDSDLLRALKVAEERLAMLGESSSKMLSIGKNLETY